MGVARSQALSELLHQKRNKISVEPNDKMCIGSSLEPKETDLSFVFRFLVPV